MSDLNHLLSTMDAKVWTDEFCRLNVSADHGTMLAWFAGAIMAGFDEANRRAERDKFSLPSGWHAVPEHPTDRQIVAGSAAMNSADRYRRMVLAAPKLPGM